MESWTLLLLLAVLSSNVVFVISKLLKDETFYDGMKPLILQKSALQIINGLDSRICIRSKNSCGWLMDMRFSYGSFEVDFPTDTSTPSPKQTVIINNNVIVLNINNHIFHFMYECIPLLYALHLDGIFKEYPKSTLLITLASAPIDTLNMKILTTLGIDLHSSKFLIAKPGLRYEVDKSHVMVISPKSRFFHRHPDDPAIAHFLFSQVADKVHSVLKQRGYNINPNPTEQIYLSREGYRRHAVNESDLFPILQQHMNLKVLTHIEQLDFVDQWALFANASLIIAPHGGALTNLWFCNLKKVAVIEMGTRLHHGSFNKWAAEWGIRKYHMMWVNATGVPPKKNEPKQVDLSFDPSTVAAEILDYLKNVSHPLYMK